MLLDRFCLFYLHQIPKPDGAVRAVRNYVRIAVGCWHSVGCCRASRRVEPNDPIGIVISKPESAIGSEDEALSATV